ncbi:MAG: FadR family transcriptional regulator [Actinobacteria bacterium]|nr:FadR family transcriptional regulator [Actinomycetota bacterium]
MNKTDQAIAELLDMIRSGQVAGGDRLPTEAELVERIGVSRSAVREAVQSLSFAGVLRVQQGGGTFVTDLAPERLLRSTGLVLELSGGDMLAELYAVRRMLEPEAAALAVERLTDAGIETLRSRVDAMRAATEPEAFVQADIAFHDTVAEIAGNRTLRALLDTLRSEATLGLIRRAREEERAEARSIAEHDAILAAMEQRDAELARAATLVHLAQGQHWLDSATA